MRVSKRIKGFTLAAAVAAAFAGSAFAAGEVHQHGSAGEVGLVLDHGKKWQTDAPLRQGMENIRAALAKEVRSIDEYEALAAKVAGEVAYMVQNCKLEPEADEQLHIVIAELMAGVEAMEGKAPGAARREGAERVAKALSEYASFFDHPGWKKP